MKRVYGFGGNLDHGQHPSPAKSAQTWTAYSEDHGVLQDGYQGQQSYVQNHDATFSQPDYRSGYGPGASTQRSLHKPAEKMEQHYPVMQSVASYGEGQADFGGYGEGGMAHPHKEEYETNNFGGVKREFDDGDRGWEWQSQVQQISGGFGEGSWSAKGHFGRGRGPMQRNYGSERGQGSIGHSVVPYDTDFSISSTKGFYSGQSDFAYMAGNCQGSNDFGKGQSLFPGIGGEPHDGQKDYDFSRNQQSILSDNRVSSDACYGSFGPPGNQMFFKESGQALLGSQPYGMTVGVQGGGDSSFRGWGRGVSCGRFAGVSGNDRDAWGGAGGMSSQQNVGPLAVNMGHGFTPLQQRLIVASGHGIGCDNGGGSGCSQGVNNIVQHYGSGGQWNQRMWRGRGRGLRGASTRGEYFRGAQRFLPSGARKRKLTTAVQSRPEQKISAFMSIVNDATVKTGGLLAKAADTVKCAGSEQLEMFAKFVKTYPDRENGIQTISNAMTASRYSLAVFFDVRELTNIGRPIFTGFLKLGPFFMCRSLALSKKAAKHDAFLQAVRYIRTLPLEQLVRLRDCGDQAVRDEIDHMKREEKSRFQELFLATSLPNEGDVSLPAVKGKDDQQVKVKDVARPAVEHEQPDVKPVIPRCGGSAGKITSGSAGKSKVTVIGGSKLSPLSDKVASMSAAVKQIGSMDQVVLAPRIDALAFKVGIQVDVLYRCVMCQVGKGQQREMSCELYFDRTCVGSGQSLTRKASQLAAYEHLDRRLRSDPPSSITDGHKLPDDVKSLENYVEHVRKGFKPNEGSNEVRLKTARMYPPNLDLEPKHMVVIEIDGDDPGVNAFKILEYSAARSGMLLTWHDPVKSEGKASSFCCEMSLNQKMTVKVTENSKAKARNSAAAMFLTDMYASQDVVHQSSTANKVLENLISMSSLLQQAKDLKEAGSASGERIDCDWAAESERAGSMSATPGPKPADVDVWISNPLRLWLEDAIVGHISAYSNKVTVDCLLFEADKLSGLAHFVQCAARHFLLQCMQTTYNRKLYHEVSIPFVTPQEIVRILHTHSSQCGLYRLVRSNTPFNAVQRASFVRTFPDVWRLRVIERRKADIVPPQDKE